MVPNKIGSFSARSTQGRIQGWGKNMSWFPLPQSTTSSDRKATHLFSQNSATNTGNSAQSQSDHIFMELS